MLGVRHREVAGEDVVERRDVGRALDRRVPAQRHDPAARPADVAEQELDDRGGADELDADRVLRPADGVDERARALAARSSRRAPRRPRGTPRPCSRTRRRRAPACSARSGASGSGRRSAGAAASRPPRAARRARARRRGRRGRTARPSRAPLKPSSRSPAAPCTSMPSYCQVVTSYLPFSGSQPEKSPSLSSVSENSLVDDHAARSCSA